MAPHLSLKELDLLRHWSGALKLSPVQIHAKLEKRRTRAGWVGGMKGEGSCEQGTKTDENRTKTGRKPGLVYL